EAAESAVSEADPTRAANLKELRRQFDRSAKLPVELVARESSATSLGMHAWADARKNSDFATFAPHLETLVGLAREKADLWGYEEDPSDAPLESYERATSTAAGAGLFDKLAPEVKRISAQAVENSKKRPANLPAGPYPLAAQQDLNRRIAESIGFDFEAGRI